MIFQAPALGADEHRALAQVERLQTDLASVVALQDAGSGPYDG
jgi:hypothetical protein